jgi:hypothetical protein
MRAWTRPRTGLTSLKAKILLLAEVRMLGPLVGVDEADEQADRAHAGPQLGEQGHRQGGDADRQQAGDGEGPREVGEGDGAAQDVEVGGAHAGDGGGRRRRRRRPGTRRCREPTGTRRRAVGGLGLGDAHHEERGQGDEGEAEVEEVELASGSEERVRGDPGVGDGDDEHAADGGAEQGLAAAAGRWGRARRRGARAP